jgi:hypothetical protein
MFIIDTTIMLSIGCSSPSLKKFIYASSSATGSTWIIGCSGLDLFRETLNLNWKLMKMSLADSQTPPFFYISNWIDEFNFTAIVPDFFIYTPEGLKP